MTAYLQREHSTGQVGSLDLRHVGGQHLVPVGPLSVEPVGLPGARPAGSTRPLLGLRLENTFLKKQFSKIANCFNYIC